MSDPETAIYRVPFIEDSSSSALRACFHCHKPQDKDVQLKRCGQCQSVFYCSKECQVAAWPSHKGPCRHKTASASLQDIATMDNQARQFGFKSSDDFSQAMRDFVEAHGWAFNHFTKAHVTLKGGNAFTKNPQKILQIDVKCLATPKSMPNPAATFQLVDHRFLTLDEYKRTPHGAEDWAQTIPIQEGARREYSVDPTFECLLPIAVSAAGTGRMTISSMFFFPLYRKLFNGFTTDQDQNYMRLTMQDVITLCVGTINAGLSLRAIEGEDMEMALPGRFVKSNKRWRWERIFDSWEQYLSGPRGLKELDAIITRLVTGDRLHEMIRFVRLLG